MRSMNKIVFQVTQEGDGGYVVELCQNVREAVAGFFFDQTKPASVLFRLERDGVLVTA